ncbi:hypothetical protein CDD81_636 [Ophiocordyceps australis]|uniref:Acyl-CoA oxidase/dehydrogenase middle domain-containing protein n=1 Tax=Ophiocordyceps australis TaxID=1399860 RepID=A0A2C5XG08_9HYPO|nr:hypothetical protein CDD81_636 [Ophiocordyceps australis]
MRPPGTHLQGPNLSGDVNTSGFDFFHFMIGIQEIARLMCRPFSDALLPVLTISLPFIIRFARHRAWSQAVIDDVLGGRKKMCLVTTEALAGSDLTGIRTKAEKTPDGKYYIVNGTKKWATNGTFCDYFVTAVRTGGPGVRGPSLLLIERGQGVETHPIKTSYSASAGATFVTFSSVRVPAEYMIGEENKAFSLTARNFP